MFTFLAAAMGAVVCSTGSGAGCPTWPGRHPDTIATQWRLSPMIEFAHRVAAIGAGPLVLAAAVMALRLPGADLRVTFLPWVALTGTRARYTSPPRGS
jgi:cytochrome c oxidase assembly protein subunit 15